MDWRDTGILLSLRHHGEYSAIIEVFTPDRGRHAGVVRGATGRRLASVLQPGAQLDLHWRARLEEHLGAFTVEPQRSRAAQAMSSRLALAGLNAVCALLSFALPEREAQAALYLQTEQLLDLLGQDALWPLAYLRWEVSLLSALGYGLDLGSCAVTGKTDGLIYVSPKSGRAVSQAGAGDWADRLLPLPPVLLGQGDAENTDIAQALSVTGFFLRERLAPALGHRPPPTARARFIDRLQVG